MLPFGHTVLLYSHHVSPSITCRKLKAMGRLNLNITDPYDNGLGVIPADSSII